MRELALILNRKRVKRGSIDFDLPEPLIEFDEWGEMTGVTRAPRNIAHRIIEEFMLAANEAVASHLETAGIPSIFRIHEPPDPQRVMEFEDIAASFGYSLGLGAMPVKRFPIVDRKRDGRKVRKDIVLADERLRVSPRHYQNLVAEDRGQARGAHPQLPDAALAQAGALQRGQRRPLRARRRHLHALHLAHPPLPRPDRPPHPRGHARRRGPARRWTSAPSPTTAPSPSAAPPKPSANWSSGRR